MIQGIRHLQSDTLDESMDLSSWAPTGLEGVRMIGGYSPSTCLAIIVRCTSFDPPKIV